ncbi:MAG: hypothetical protein MK041_01270 [Aquabacterium sp.]|nr:hypothetical protein [Aquabacterium sp.]
MKLVNVMQNKRLAAVRYALVDAAVDVQALANRLRAGSAELGEHADEVNAAAEQLAEVVRALGAGFSTHTLAMFFGRPGDHVDPAHAEAPDD